MKKLTFILILTVMLLGCNSAQNDEELYQKYLAKSMNIEYKIVYDLDFDSGDYFGDFNMKSGLFKKGDKSKAVIEIKVMDEAISTSLYNVSGDLIVCMKENSYSDNAEMQCMKMETMTNSQGEYLQFSSSYSDFEAVRKNVTYVGQETVLDRNCDVFEYVLPDLDDLELQGGFTELIKASAAEGSTSKIKVCRDKATGVPLSVELLAFVESELVDEDEPQVIYSQKAISFETEVDDEVFELPVKFSIAKSYCDSELVLFALDGFQTISGNLKIEIMNTYGDDVLKTFDIGEKTLSPGKTEWIEKATSSAGTYGNKIRVCVGDECTSKTCYASDTCIKYSQDKDKCNAEKACVFQNDYCERFSCSKYKDISDCSKYDKCYWSDSGSYQYCTTKSCYIIKNEKDCLDASYLNCEWNGKSCSTFSCYSKKTKSDCEKNSKLCYWNDPKDIGTCSERVCYTLTSQTACEDAYSCNWDGQRCNKFSCYSYRDSNTCNSYDECYWTENTYSSTGGSCNQKSCYDYKTSADCKNAPVNCAWKNNQCAMNSCTLKTDQTSCEISQACYWRVSTSYSQGSCSQYTCSGFKTQTECNNNDKLNCEWKENTYSGGYCATVYDY